MIDKKYEVIISQRAKIMLGTHLAFIAKISKSSAKKTKSKLMSAFYSLSKMPQRFPFIEEEHLPSNKYHKMYVEKWYVVLYQIKDDTVFVEYIIDCRQDYSWLGGKT